MQIRPDQLRDVLQQNLPKAVVLSSEDTFLINEAAAQVRHAVKQQGYDERLSFTADTSFDWNELIHLTQSQSLFFQRRLIEINLLTWPDESASKILAGYFEVANEDTLLLLKLGKLDKKALRSAWFKMLDTHATVCRIWPVKSHELQGWIQRRMQQASVRAEPEAIRILVESVEGNLLAAVQEIKKLSLAHPDTSITATQMLRSIGNSARFDPYDLLNACLTGQASNAQRILYGLRSEGNQPLAILWPLSRELHTIAKLQSSQASGKSLYQAFSSMGIWKARQGPIKAFLHRNSDGLASLLVLAAKVDHQAKSSDGGNPWDSLTELAAAMAGHPLKLA